MIGNAWDALLPQDAIRAALQNADDDAKTHTVYPPRERVFAALKLTPPEAVRVVILGQDPYHEPGQAHGPAFSVPDGVKLPPSLKNIYKELQSDLGIARASGDLTGWAEQGVLLLNTVLTVRRGEANSHKNFGWQTVTDAIAAAIAELPQPVAFLLWGAQAQEKAALARASKYPRLVLCSPHPSPLSAYRGFFGSRPFSQINEFLSKNGEKPIDWRR
ncbi:MAG: uracil-DNA glycosylase [Oscillospiraceae bacterium]|nr:uracil-DNA glycosylase [Oscillospiraceae bacterium]